MADANYRAPDGFLTMAEVEERLGASRVTVLRRLERAGIEVYRDPMDGRVRLVRAEDLAQLTNRQPIPEREMEGKVAA